MTRGHYQSGWHGFARHLGIIQPGICSYCSEEGSHHQCLVYIMNKEKKVYKCDACYHLGAKILPHEKNYEGSWGHVVAMLRRPKRQMRTRTPEPSRKRATITEAEEMSPEKSARLSYRIYWDNEEAASPM